MHGYRHYIIAAFFAFLANFSFSQIKEFDKLEMLYDQQHYALVLKKSKKLLDNPEYDFSLVPSLYKSMSLFQLSQNEYWLKRHPEALEEARDLFVKIKSSSDGNIVIQAHIFEISALKKDLTSWSEDLKRTGKRQAFEHIQELMNGLFDQIPDIEEKVITKSEIAGVVKSNESAKIIGTREEIIQKAIEQIGVPYQWAGEDNKGFDCSGFTSYVLKSAGINLPRRAVEQYEASVKIKAEDAKKGDLIFFDSGSGINHVGIIVSNPGESLKMIHSSSSKGVIITEVPTSSYWSKRVAGYGRFVGESTK